MHLVPKLEVQNIVMEFPGVRALNDVSVAVEAAEVHAIVGENGAGKSTLMKILSGVQRATSGSILIDGSPVSFSGVRDAINHGIAMIHQELNLVDELTVAENVFLGREITRAGALDRAAMASKTDGYLKQVHAHFGPSDKVGQLSIAEKQLVEIAKAIAVEASILIMDEPTAVLSEPEAKSLFELVAKLKAGGTTVLYISHRLAEVCDISDRITVLRDGAKITTIPAQGAKPAEVADLMVGRPMTDFYPPKVPPPDGEPVFAVKGVNGVSFVVRPGEILGLAGLVGAGRTELGEAIVGARTAVGEVHIDGKAVRISDTKQAMRHGVVYVSEDRKGLGLHLTLSVIHNVTLPSLRGFGQFLVDQRKEQQVTEDWKQSLDIRTADLGAPVERMSGGNQQKVAIAKWLQTKPRVLILDEPTRGVDVGAKREIYDLIQRFAGEGLACIVISSELPEIIGLCHRSLVMRDGKLVGELAGEGLTEEAVMRLAAGVAA